MKITQKWIADITQGRSFVDVGGLWGTNNERMTDAAKAGASSITMADIMPPDHELWKKFEARCTELGVSGYRCASVDIMAADAPGRIGVHDIVHCSGLIYHVPDPMGLLRQLRNLSNDYLILVSMIVPERIDTNAGTLSLQGGEVLFVPALNECQLGVLREFFRERNLQIRAIVNHRSESWIKPDGTPNTGPWWWLFTPTILRRMVQVAGFRVIEDAPVWERGSHGFLCRKA